MTLPVVGSQAGKATVARLAKPRTPVRLHRPAPPGIPNRLFPRPSPAILSYPILSCISRPRWAAPCLAASRSDMLPAWPAWRPSARLAWWLVAVRELRQPHPLGSDMG
jgi:hypothetical protein